MPLVLPTLVYLAFPLAIFFCGWLKPVWAVLSLALLANGGWSLARRWPVEKELAGRGDLLFLAIFSLGVAAFAGIGGYAPQQFDWAKHNAVLADSVRQAWPVVLVDGTVRWPLVYYLAYYLPAALAGKMAGYAAAQAALWIWSASGVVLTCLWFERLTGLSARRAAGAFFLFAGPVVVANLAVQLLGLPGTLGWTGLYPYELWARIWQFGSHFWLLEWVPNQALAGWLSAAMFLSCPGSLRPLGFGFLFVCVLLWSPLVAIGLGLLAFFLVLSEGGARPARPLMAPLLNLVVPGCVLGIFYVSKISPDVRSHFPKIAIAWFWRFQDAPYHFWQSVLLLGLFVVLQFGVLYYLLRHCFERGGGERRLADACVLALVCLLPVTVGYYSDLAMRACIVPWFGLAVLTARAIFMPWPSLKLRRYFYALILIGALTPLCEAGDQGIKLLTHTYDPSVIPQPVSAVVHMPADGFDFFGAQYVGSTNSFFWRHLAR